MLRHDALTRYLKQNALPIPFSLRDMGGKRHDDIWSWASNSTRQHGVPLNFAFVCFLVLTGASELATDPSRGGELGKAQSMFCAKIPLFASINQNSCYHFYPPHLIDYIACLAISHTSLLFTLPLSVCTHPTKAQTNQNQKPKGSPQIISAPPASRIMQPIKRRRPPSYSSQQQLPPSQFPCIPPTSPLAPRKTQ